MKQFTKTLAIGLFLVSSTLVGSPAEDHAPSAYRLRTWAEIHAGARTFKSESHRINHHSSKSKIKVLPVMPGFAVQLGAFSSRSNAENLVFILQKKGVENIYYHRSVVRGKTFHKVVVGPFRERKNAIQRWSLIRNAYGLKEGYVTAI